MTCNELYYEFSTLCNRNFKFENANIDKGNFVMLFNREKDRWLNNFLIQSNSTDNINDVRELYVKDQPILFSSAVKAQQYRYFLPEDFFQFSNCYSVAKKNECEGRIINFLPKPKDELSHLADGYNIPSFEFEEGICNINSNNFIVYANNFEIILTYLSYYKKVGAIDMAGYITPNNTPSTDIQPNVSDFLLNQILDWMVVEVERQFAPKNSQFQISKERQNSVITK